MRSLYTVDWHRRTHVLISQNNAYGGLLMLYLLVSILKITDKLEPSLKVGPRFLLLWFFAQLGADIHAPRPGPCHGEWNENFHLFTLASIPSIIRHAGQRLRIHQFSITDFYKSQLKDSQSPGARLVLGPVLGLDPGGPANCPSLKFRSGRPDVR